MNLNIYELDELLMHVETIFDGWHSDGTAWSEWDERIRQRLLDFRTKYTYRPSGYRWHEVENKEKLMEGDTVPLKFYAQVCDITQKKINQIMELQKQVKDRDAEIEELKERLNNAEIYAAKKDGELSEIRLSQKRAKGE